MKTRELLFRPAVLFPGPRVVWEGVASLRTSRVPVCSVHMGCRLVSCLCSGFLWLLPCNIEQLYGCDRLGDCQLWLVLPQPKPFHPHLKARCWSVPCGFALHLSQSWPQLQNNLTPFIAPCVSYHLACPWLTFKLGFKRLLITSQEQSSWRPFWGNTSLGLRSRGWAEGQQLCSCPHHAFHDAGVDPNNLQIPPQFLPSPTLASSWHCPRLSLPPKYLGLGDWKADRRFSGSMGTDVVCLFVGEENTARDYAFIGAFLGDFWGREIQ